MSRRAIPLACAAAAALAAFASPAVAAPTCNTTSGGTFDGTIVCVDTHQLVTGWVSIPYSVGEICVGTTCTEPQSGTVDVPIVNGDPADAYGTVCVNTARGRLFCLPFSTNDIVST